METSQARRSIGAGIIALFALVSAGVPTVSADIAEVAAGTDAPAAVAAASAAAAAPMAVAAAPASAADSVFDYRSLEKRALDVHPILKEKALEVDKTRQQLHELKMSAILPKFTIETAVGPAPGLRPVRDTTSLIIPPGPDSPGGYVTQYRKEYDYSEWGPFFGIEMNVAQPLNLGRYRSGVRARSLQVKVSEAEFYKEQMDISEQAQELYFQRVYAGLMSSLLEDAAKELDKAQRKMEDQLEEGDKGVAQTDLLELKTGRFNLEKGRSEARLGVARADLGISFLVQLPNPMAFRLTDSVLAPRKEVLPSLDSLKMLTLQHHPDLKRLKNGLAARNELIRVAKGELGPDIFLFGQFNYTKAWSSDRESGGDDPFARDPLNEITAVGGIGFKLNLNFWQRYEKVRKERIELRQLQKTEAYAATGLLLKLQDEYAQMLRHRTDVGESQKSLRAAEAWLKASAMKYDLDPSSAKDLFDAYRAVLSAKHDYYDAVQNFNIAVAKVIRAVGWTLSDYFNTLGG